MNNHLRYLIIILFIPSFLVSCDKDEFLTVPSKDKINETFVYDSEVSADMALAYLYGSLPDWESQTRRGIAGSTHDYTYDKFENYSDNSCGLSWFISWQRSVDRAYTADSWGVGSSAALYNHNYPALPFVYDKVYQGIRACNKFIEGMTANEDNFTPESFQEKIGEAKFIRAYFYHNLWMAYGGVPIIEEPLNRISMDSTELYQPRSTYQQTAQYITGELEEILENDMLPNERGAGRATRGACLALKGWVELFNHQYEAAAATYKIIIDEGVYQLYTTPSAVVDDPRFGPYNEQFFEENNNNVESIFAIQHETGVIANHRLFWANPRYTQASWNLVQDYRMKDGLSPEESPLWKMGEPGFHFYTNREPRFYQTIAYPGGDYLGGAFPPEYEAETDLQTGFVGVKGVDPRKSITESTARNFAANTPIFRYAEVLLHYAEAKIELNEIDQTVYDAIDAVRQRGGIPTLKDSYSASDMQWKLTDQDEMRRIVREETRIELAFENKRYWDLIRWGNHEGTTDYYTAMVELNKPRLGAREVPDGDGFKMETVVVHKSVFNERNYLFPLYREWIENNPAIMEQSGPEWVNGQNPGY